MWRTLRMVVEKLEIREKMQSQADTPGKSGDQSLPVHGAGLRQEGAASPPTHTPEGMPVPSPSHQPRLLLRAPRVPTCLARGPACKRGMPGVQGLELGC